MAPVYKVRGPGDIPTDTFTDISTYFQLYKLDVTMSAEEGAQSQSTVQADDPLGVFDIVGQRQFRVEESTATGSNAVIYVGYTADRAVSRGEYRSDTARVWDINLIDINTVIDRRVMTGSDANRPAETDVARIQWLEATNEGSLIDDTRFIHTDSPVSMDAVDYRGQRFRDVIDDCAQQSGKNYYLAYMGDTDQFTLWYGFAASSNYTSPLRLTNDLTEVDDTWTFAISNDTELRRDPSRVNSGAYLPYDGGNVYQQRIATYNAFSQRDAIMPAENVKTLAKATARNSRYLVEMSTEEDVITTTVILPAAKVNFLMQGMQVQFRAVHLPGFETYTYLRVLNRSVSQISEQEDRMYAVKMELASGDAAADSVAGASAGIVLYQPINTHLNVYNRSPDIVWKTNGDAPASGYASYPKFGLLDYTTPTANFAGVVVGGTGTVDITAKINFAEVFAVGTRGVSLDVYKGGSIVGTNGVTRVFTSGSYWSDNITLTMTGLSVAPGDVLSAKIGGDLSLSGRFPNVPSGAGSTALKFLVTGTLA